MNSIFLQAGSINFKFILTQADFSHYTSLIGIVFSFAILDSIFLYLAHLPELELHAVFPLFLVFSFFSPFYAHITRI